MLNKIVIAIGLLFGSFLVAWGQSSTLSNLSSGSAITNSDLFYDVQTPGTGGVKVTGSQLLSYIFGNISGNCGASPTGVLTCSGLATNAMTSIVAGTNVTTSGTVTNTTVNVIATPTFSSITSPLAFISGWLTASGVNMQTATIVGNLTGSTAQFTGALTGTTAVFQTVTINNLTPTGPKCLQETGGVVQATNAACGTGGGGSSVTGGPILPSSEYLGGASGLLFPNFFIPGTNTSGAGAFEGIGYIATATIATATLQFNMPENIPTGNARLRILQMANATTGTVQYTISDAVTSSSNSLGTVTLNFEGVSSIAQTVADQLIEKKITLTVTPTANQIMSVVIGTTSSVAQTITYQPTIVWE